jgi:hypothetical protein
MKKKTTKTTTKKAAKKTTAKKATKKIVKKEIKKLFTVTRFHEDDIVLSLGKVTEGDKVLMIVPLVEDKVHIPKGTYPVTTQWTKAEGNHFLILNVKGHDNATIKASSKVMPNTMIPIQDVFSYDSTAVEGSTVAMQRLWNILKDGFTLIVE